MPGLEPLTGLRVVASPDALDAARWAGDGVVVLRFAPDEAFAIGARAVSLSDGDAIVLPERGFVGAWCDRDIVGEHVEWPMPAAGPALAQGKVAGVPAKVWFDGDASTILLVTQAAYAADLEARLGWTR